MATSGTASLTFNIAEIIEEAYERAGVDVQMLNAGHMITARRSLNMILLQWNNRTIVPWATDLRSFTTVQGTASYELPADTIDVLPDVTFRHDGYDTAITRISRQDYEIIPEKDMQGRPNRYFVHRVGPPVMYLWQVPENSNDTIRYWRIRRLQDATASAQTLDTPDRWIPAVTSALALALYEKTDKEYDPRRLAVLASHADRDFDEMRRETSEPVSVFFTPCSYGI